LTGRSGCSPGYYVSQELPLDGTLIQSRGRDFHEPEVEIWLQRKWKYGVGYSSGERQNFLSNAIFPLPDPNIFRRLKLCTFGVELLGTGSGNMASDIVQANALGRRFGNLN